MTKKVCSDCKYFVLKLRSDNMFGAYCLKMKDFLLMDIGCLDFDEK